jgi:hypothetical protein
MRKLPAAGLSLPAAMVLCLVAAYGVAWGAQAASVHAACVPSALPPGQPLIETLLGQGLPSRR